MKGSAFLAFLAAVQLGVSSAVFTADHAENDSRRMLVKSRRGLQVGDNWIAEVRGSENCGIVRHLIEEWNIDNVARRSLRNLEDDDLSIKIIAMQKICMVTFSGPEELRDHVRSLDNVIDVEPDLEVMAESAPESWGLDRVDQADLPLSKSSFTASHDGIGVNVYVIDTGINKDHVEFGGRAKFGANFISGENNPDRNGHGTHCSGTATGATFGIAKRATVFGVKVLSGGGSGSTSGVISGIQWAVNNQLTQYPGESAVLSMSLGGGFSQAMNDAVVEAAEAGMIVVVAAGNENQDACNVSPASAGGNAHNGGVITVGSTTVTDAMSGFSNYGTCTDVFAPGSDIKSAWIGSTTATRSISGTSMATPHVAGVAAILLEKHNKNKDAAQAELLSLVVADKVRFIGANSPNLLLQVPTYTGPPTPPTMQPTMPPTNAPDEICVGDLCVNFAMSQFGPSFPNDELMTGEFVATTDLMCSPTDEDFTGKIVMVPRGECLFFDKVKNVENQGAKAVLIHLVELNAVIFPPAYYGTDETDIPSCMISRRTADSLLPLVGQQARLGSPSLTPAPVGPTHSPTTAAPTPPTASPTQVPTQMPTARPTEACEDLRGGSCKKRDDCAWIKIPSRHRKKRCYDISEVPAIPDITTPGDCSAKFSFSTAKAQCEKAGLRLCTSEELEMAGRIDDGCKLEKKWVWVADENDDCDGDKRKITKSKNGKSKCKDRSQKYNVRCCDPTPEENPTR